MTCREFTEFLNAYVDGTLAPAETAEFDRHLAVCSNCVRYLETYKQTIELTAAAFEGERDGAEPLPDDVPPDLVKAILAAVRPKP